MSNYLILRIVPKIEGHFDLRFGSKFSSSLRVQKQRSNVPRRSLFVSVSVRRGD